ncbi:hypothetical protein PP175_25595 (plasmid) [Aneurinibacillus sp. Ricciae_BoGa-3]|uniref:DUF6908 domain-containing protein n=1 Tax=Aneurinibacillus sp. Ricciae_BoGa-3 TaxID=3022697 RepID=UPI002342445B|nr:hypothetical protein [Aneurinibacillus sp. Ricciae_BoGa-3]WCK57444.1 hypothetical protein PP175_25595 [Aneurinibacillus sp. Ricciae_BoGa-3]
MFKRFRSTVEKIIVKHGHISLKDFYASSNVTIKVQRPHFLDFVIEKTGNTIFVGYYRKQNGDLISDPIFVFEYREETEYGEDKWFPIRLEQVLDDRTVGLLVNEQYRYYPSAFKDVRSFATNCATEWKAYYLE